MTEAFNSTPTSKVYKTKDIFGAAILGEPLAAGYAIAQNFKAFGDSRKYKITIYTTLVFSALLFVSVIFMEDTGPQLPKRFIPFVYAAIFYGVANFYQAHLIDEHINAGGEVFKIGRTALVIVISLAITVVTFLLLFTFLTREDKIENYIFTFKNQPNEVEYYADRVSKEEVVRICNQLTQTDFLDSSYKQYFVVDKVKGVYQIKIPSNTNIWDDPANITYCQNLQTYLKQFYTPNTLSIILCDSTYAIKREFK